MSLLALLRDLATSSENTDLEQRAYGRAEVGTVLSVGSSGAPAFQNGWYGYGGVEFLRDRWARVRLGGLVARFDKIHSGAVIFYLPVGYRPPAPVEVASSTSSSSYNSYDGRTYWFDLAVVRIETDGAIKATYSASSTDDLEYLSLDGIDFPV